MRVSFINSFYPPDVGGGAEITLSTIAGGLANRGHEVDVIATSLKAASSYRGPRAEMVYKFPIENRYWPYKMARKGAPDRFLWNIKDRYNKPAAVVVSEFLRDRRPDVLFAHNLSGFSRSVWDAAASLDIPVVQVLHDYYHVCPRTSTFRQKSCQMACVECRIFRLGANSSSRELAAVVGVSKAVLTRHHAFGLFEGVDSHVIHNAREMPVPTAPSRARAPRIVFGFLGSLIPIKGIDWLIREFMRVKRPGWQLLIGGTGDATYQAKLAKIGDEESVRFLGQVDALSFFREMDVLVLPSLWEEPFPGVAYEACSQNVPVIASDAGGISEIISDGVNGILCDRKDEQSLGNAILKVGNDPELLRRLSSEARRHVINLLDVDRMVASYEAVLVSSC